MTQPQIVAHWLTRDILENASFFCVFLFFFIVIVYAKAQDTQIARS